MLRFYHPALRQGIAEGMTGHMLVEPQSFGSGGLDGRLVFGHHYANNSRIVVDLCLK
jgi:hypothetical protein